MNRRAKTTEEGLAGPDSFAHASTSASTDHHIRVLIADDHPIVRQGLRHLLEPEPDIRIVGEATTAQEVLEMVPQLKPDIVLLDLILPGMEGTALLRALQPIRGHSKILVFTAVEDKAQWVQAMKLGCSGIVVKSTRPELIVKSIRKVYEGEIWLDSKTTAAVMQQFSSSPDGASDLPASRRSGRQPAPLSRREREIVALVAQGYRNREMAEKLFISEQTVKNHLHNIFDKLGVSDRLELALYAIHKGLHVYPPEDQDR